jgi:hypothetical protein
VLDSCSLLRAEGFFCILEILYGDLGIGNIVFFPKKFFAAVNFFQLLVIKTLDPVWIRIRIKYIRIRNAASEDKIGCFVKLYV